MRHAIALVLWLCVLVLFALSPATPPDDPHEARRAWLFLHLALLCVAVAMLVEAS